MLVGLVVALFGDASVSRTGRTMSGCSGYSIVTSVTGCSSGYNIVVSLPACGKYSNVLSLDGTGGGCVCCCVCGVCGVAEGPEGPGGGVWF